MRRPLVAAGSFVLALLLWSLGTVAHSQPIQVNAATLAAADAVVKADANKKFLGADMGLGVALTFAPEPRVTDAEVVNGVVRVNKDQQYVPRVVWEAHYFVGIGEKVERKIQQPDGTVVTEELRHYGIGPFVSLQSSGEEIVDAVGIGLLIGMRKDLKEPDSVNIGFGYLWEKSVKDLGDGVLPNRALPEGETVVRYKESSRGALTLLVSFSF